MLPEDEIKRFLDTEPETRPQAPPIPIVDGRPVVDPRAASPVAPDTPVDELDLELPPMRPQGPPDPVLPEPRTVPPLSELHQQTVQELTERAARDARRLASKHARQRVPFAQTEADLDRGLDELMQLVEYRHSAVFAHPRLRESGREILKAAAAVAAHAGHCEVAETEGREPDVAPLIHAPEKMSDAWLRDVAAQVAYAAGQDEADREEVLGYAGLYAATDAHVQGFQIETRMLLSGKSAGAELVSLLRRNPDLAGIALERGDLRALTRHPDEAVRTEVARVAKLAGREREIAPPGRVQSMLARTPERRSGVEAPQQEGPRRGIRR